MICPKCGEEVSQELETCPNCGAAMTAPEQDVDTQIAETPAEVEENTQPAEENEEAQDAAEETETEEAAEAEAENAAETSEPAETEEKTESDEPAEPAETQVEAPKKKKKSAGAIIAGVVIVLLAVIVVCLAAALSYVSKNGKLPSLSEIAEQAKEEKVDGDAVAVNVQNADGETVEEITNQQLSYYFWGEYFYYVNNYGFSFDASLPLDEQTYQEATDSETGETTVTTWEDYFLENAQNSIIQTVALKAEAESKDFAMPDDYQSEYDSVVENMASNAANAGFTDEDGNGDVLAYIQDSYGDNSTVESFEQYLYDSYYVSAYSDSIYQGFSFDDDQIEEYYDENADMLQSYGIEKSDLPDVNVRHILIEPEADEDGNITDDAWTAAEEKAQEVLAEWQSGDADEESFGELANTYSTDTGSNTNGGLYEDVYPGQMITEFNDWCFDASRKPGDTGIVKTSYGYHVMYFVSFTDTYYYKTVAEQELRYSTYSDYITSLVDQYTSSLTSDAGVVEPSAVKEIQQNAAEQAAQAEQEAQEAQNAADSTNEDTDTQSSTESSNADSAVESAEDSTVG